MEKKESMKQYIYSQLKEAILTRKLAPGKQLVENTISETLNVSRTPIRSAINLLAGEGLVDIVPNKGAFVTNPSKEEILQAYELRKSLEIMAAERSMNNLTEDDYIEMKSIVIKEKAALDNKDIVRYLDANKDFHMIFSKKCENKFLTEFIEKLIKQTSIYLLLFDVYFEDSSQQPYGYKEHLEIIDLFKQKNLSQLKNCLRNHFDHAIDNLNIHNEYKKLDSIFETKLK
ncbi:GntR family transcriptional regulator [Virgibacillus necropolis]|uniref:GntR family transcriptional regulator n=1 Tax=Virgibacillus necropolis TaxID=163877 RepID=A0A221MI22_9BACI|nr:GntR family transcriptional regulator [Virgibacillus necropolis]